MRSLLKFLSVTCVLISFCACKKSSTGGNATVVIFPAHHGASIKGATVYVKFKTNDLPSNPTANYDLKIEGDPSEDHIHVKGLRYGKYYFYVEGFDSAVSETVSGGAPLTIKWKERKEEINFNVAVTE